MKASESIGLVVLLVGGALALKLAGGVKGITDLFGGLFNGGNGAGGGGSNYATAQDILTETSALETQYAALSPAGQEYATTIQGIDILEQEIQQDPRVQAVQYASSLPLEYIPIVGPLLDTMVGGITGQIESYPEVAKQVTTKRYMTKAQSKATRSDEVKQQIRKVTQLTDIKLPKKFLERYE